MLMQERLRTRREAMGLSARELGRRSGVAETHVSLIERGTIVEPRTATVKALAEALECEPAWLMFDAGDPPEPPVAT